jgi:hypothetical protein
VVPHTPLDVRIVYAPRARAPPAGHPSFYIARQ